MLPPHTPLAGQLSGHEAKCPCLSVGDRGCPFTALVSVRLSRACAAAVIKVIDSCMCERAGYYDEGER